jgi:hypothetical protein
MTAHFIARVVDSLYQKMDVDAMINEFKGVKKYNDSGHITDEWYNQRIEEKSYYRWCKAIALLERYCRMNWETFEETELVYTWASNVCDARNEDKNIYRAYENPFNQQTFSEYLKKKNFYYFVK